MTITQISAWIMLVSCGLWAGGILIFAVERTNLWGECQSTNTRLISRKGGGCTAAWA
jgi:hypothetical protein